MCVLKTLKLVVVAMRVERLRQWYGGLMFTSIRNFTMGRTPEVVSPITNPIDKLQLQDGYVNNVNYNCHSMTSKLRRYIILCMRASILDEHIQHTLAYFQCYLQGQRAYGSPKTFCAIL